MATVRALETFAAFTDTGVVGVAKDQAFDSKDPLVKKFPSKFAADAADEDPKPRRRQRVEQATANPGEIRDI